MWQRLLKYSAHYKKCIRYYSIEPPDWLGGKNILFKSGKHNFPGYSKSFEERMSDLKINDKDKVGKNLGFKEPTSVKKNKEEIIRIQIKNRKNKDLEKQSRLMKLLVPLDEIEIENKSEYIFNVAAHYSIFQDLFGDDYFYPVVELEIGFPFDGENMTPVFFGNRIVPSEAKDKPLVKYKSNAEEIYSLILVSPDSNVFDSDKEVVHWIVTNIKGDEFNSGEEIVKYLQPISALGTGYHRLIFLLFRHKDNMHINFNDFKLKSENCLEDRSFSTKYFWQRLQDNLIPVGLSFFQSSWDLSVRDVFHKHFGIEEPRYDYKHPIPYHPPPIKYPHKQPFDRYFDRYRDKKDLVEEVLKIKLANSTVLESTSNKIDDYESVSKLLWNECKYPLVHQKRDKPSWLKRKEDIMFRKLEQFRQLNE